MERKEGVIMYIKHPNESAAKLLELTNKFIKAAGHKVQAQY